MNVKTWLYYLFGQLSWQCPPWFSKLKQYKNQHPLLFYGFWSLFFLMLCTYAWYQHLPQPKIIISQISAPLITPLDKTLVPQDLTIEFGQANKNSFIPTPVAKLSLLNKPLSGITIQPAMPGTFTFVSDSQIIFKPKIDWPAKERFYLTFPPNIFEKKKIPIKLDAEFETRSLMVNIAELTFYQDPIKPHIKQVIAQINSNFPLDKDSLEKHLFLQMPAIKNEAHPLPFKQIPFTLSFDKFFRTAYLRSNDLPLDTMPRSLQLTLKAGVKSHPGTGVTTADHKMTIVVPSLMSFFKITNAATNIINKDNNIKTQVLTIETNVGVDAHVFDAAVSAYVLPTQPNITWNNPGQVTPKLLSTLVPLKLTPLPADHEYPTQHHYQFYAAHGEKIFIEVKSGIKSLGDYELSQSYRTILSAPLFPREIHFLHEGAVLALGTEEKISLLVQGIPIVKFRLARILPREIIHLITQTDGNFSHPYFQTMQFNEENISEIFSNLRNFDANDLAQIHYTAFDLKSYLKNPQILGSGLFLLSANGYDPENKTLLTNFDQRLILITDLGIIAKDNQNGTHDVFVESITKGTPVSNATVSILGKNGIALFHEKTDEEGHVNFPDVSHFINEQQPSVYLIEKNNDLSFLPYNRFERQLNYSRFDVGGITTAQNSPDLTAFVFSDRGIYRPGDTVHFGFIVKRQYAEPETKDLPLEISLTDPLGKVVKNELIHLNPLGFHTFDYHINSYANTGTYDISIHLLKNNKPETWLGNTSIQVQEFLPDRLRIRSHLSKTALGWLSPDNLKAYVTLENLYGAPAAFHRISGKMVLTPEALSLPGFENYHFVTPLPPANETLKTIIEDLPDTETNQNGEAMLSLNLDTYIKNSYQLTLNIEGFEKASGQSVASEIKTMISHQPYLIGYKSDDDLQYIKRNQSVPINFLAIDANLKPVAVPVYIKQNQLLAISTLVKKENGTYQYESVITKKLIHEENINLQHTSTPFHLDTKEVGNYEISVLDQGGEELTHFNYSVVGNGSPLLQKNSDLQVKLNKTVYLPNESIEVAITAPYQGTALISIERDKVYAFKWVKLTGTSSLQKIILPKTFTGNGYINVELVRDINAPEIYMNPLSYQVVPFKVEDPEKKINIQLSHAAVAKPGQTFDINYQTDKESDIVLFAVDEGILQAGHFATPDPLAYFFRKYALTVRTLQIVDQILPKFIMSRELSAAGGDDSLKAAASLKLLNPFKRNAKIPAAFWSGILPSSKISRAWQINLPEDFNGKLRIMAIAVNKKAVGSTETSANIHADFVVTPHTPTVLAPHDVVTLTAIIHNASNRDEKNIKIELTTSSHLKILSNASFNISLKNQEEKTLKFKVSAEDKLGEASINWIVKTDHTQNNLSETLSIRPLVPLTTSLQNGISTKDKLDLMLKRRLYPEFGNIKLAISSTPLILVSGLARYLEEYPFGCTEQLTSKAFPLIALNNNLGLSDEQKTTQKLQELISLISERQTSSGGFSYWPDFNNNIEHEFSTIYALHFLTEAKEHNIFVREEILENGLHYLEELVNKECHDFAEARLHAYALYVLTRNERIVSNALAQLTNYLDEHFKNSWRQDITGAYIAASLQLLQNDTAAAALISAYQPNRNQDANDFYNQRVCNAIYVYLVNKHFPHQSLHLDTLLTDLILHLNSVEMSTLDTAFSMLAINAYDIKDAPRLDIQVKTVDSENTEHLLYNQDPTNEIYNLSTFVKEIHLFNPDKQKFYYQLSESGFDKFNPTASYANEIEVHREYEFLDKNLKKVKLGNEVTVDILIRTLNEKNFQNVAIIDLLPSGFEIIRESVEAQNMDYYDIREDRILFFGSVFPESKHIRYKLKATSEGTFSIPAILAYSMYHPNIRSLDIGEEKLTVSSK